MRALPSDALPAVTADQMREVDRVMMVDLGVGLLQMMENAGRSLAWLCLELYEPASVAVLAGPGGNGGGGMVAARHLANRGVRVTIVLGGTRERMVAAAHTQLVALEAMGVSVEDEPPSTDRPAVVIDALVGYSLAGPPRGRVRELIAWANSVDCPVISLDVPSGFDAQAGVAMTPCVRADATLTVAAPKVGMVGAPEAGAHLPRRYLSPDTRLQSIRIRRGRHLRERVGRGRDGWGEMTVSHVRRIHIGSDHAGFEAKSALVVHFRNVGHEVIDHGAFSYDAGDDYPRFCISAASAVIHDGRSLGIVLGGSGNGEQIAANKVEGVRSALAWSIDTARLARTHNDANVLAIGARMHDMAFIIDMADAFVSEHFTGEARHVRRIRQVAEYEDLRQDERLTAQDFGRSPEP